MKLQIKHKTKYSYLEKVNLCHNQVILKPINLIGKQHLISFEISIENIKPSIDERIDFFGNNVHYFCINQTHKELIINTNSVVETYNSFSYFGDIHQIQLLDYKNKFKYSSESSFYLASQFIIPSIFIDISKEVKEFANNVLNTGFSLYSNCINLMNYIYKNFKFESGFTNINTPIPTILSQKKGVCQDFAHLMIATLRAWEIPARYVSGYIETLPPEGKEKLVGTDASHAWVSVFFGEWGWLEFDPTNNIQPNEQHVVLAYGRDFEDISPVKGVVITGSNPKLKVSVDVSRL